MASNIQINIVNEEVYSLGDDIAISITLLNTGDSNSMIKLPVISSGKLKSDIFIVKNDENNVEYQGLFIKTNLT